MTRCATAAALAVAAALLAAPAYAAEWYVLCDRATGEIALRDSPEDPGTALLAGPFPGARTAGIWVAENHPDGRCDAAPATPTPAPPPKTSPSAGGRWIAVCSRATGSVELVQGAPPRGTMVLWGDGISLASHGERAAASAWAARACPSWRCDTTGRCARGLPPATPPPPPARWVAGELVSSIRPPAPTRPPHARAAVAGPDTVAGPGTADLTPLVRTATAAAQSCAYPAALASADHMVNFDPEHPWLQANFDTLRRLAGRQQATERSAWQASAALQQGELERARELAGRAADTAVSCQTKTVAQLLHGIDTAIEQQKAARHANRRRAAAALLPGLINLAGAISGHQAGTVELDAGTVSSVVSSFTPSGIDLCAFQLEYRDPGSVLPTCTCPGYIYDAASFRCVR